MRRYRKADTTAESIATTASQYERASTAAPITSNLATKPVVNGTPAWASRKKVRASANAGRRAPSPSRSSRLVPRSPGPDTIDRMPKLPITMNE